MSRGNMKRRQENRIWGCGRLNSYPVDGGYGSGPFQKRTHVSAFSPLFHWRLVVTASLNTQPSACFAYDQQVLERLDIAMSRCSGIEVISGSGRVMDDVVTISLWARGDHLLVKVLQPKVNPGLTFAHGRHWSHPMEPV